MNESMTPKPEGCQVPLTELLRSVPVDAREWIEESPYSGRNIPYGRMCHEAADAIAAALARAKKAEAELAQYKEDAEIRFAADGDEIGVLESELERARKDAERYRWLRDECDDWIQWHGYVEDGNPDAFDAAIDAAMKEHGNG